jgi:3',5'-cyclic AMP phosphodiesterase CpdA
MRTIVHISDLHFGRVDPEIPPVLARTISAARPDVVVVSGDLTQRARTSQFAEARRFVDTLPKPQIVVPGNHDVPLYNVLARWLWPLAGFTRFFGENLEPFFCDDEVAIVGINTARSLTFKSGRINREQLGKSCARLSRAGADTLRIVATHHPFAAPEGNSAGLVGRAQMAIEEFARCGVDIILSGHMHASHAISSAERYGADGRAALLVQAGTATSDRVRGETNAFNILAADGPHLAIRRMTWNGQAFDISLVEQFERREIGWHKI